MRIVCPQCGFSRDVPSDKIPASSNKATCPKCKFRFRFRGHSQHAPMDAPEEPVYPPRPSRPVKGWELPEEPAQGFEARSQAIYSSGVEHHHAPSRPQARWLPDPEPDSGPARESLGARLRPGTPFEPLAGQDDAGVYEPEAPDPFSPAASRSRLGADHARGHGADVRTAYPPAADPHGRMGEPAAPLGRVGEVADPYGRMDEAIGHAHGRQAPERSGGYPPHGPDAPARPARHAGYGDHLGSVPPVFAPDERPDEEPPYDPAPPREDYRASSRLQTRQAEPEDREVIRPSDRKAPDRAYPHEAPESQPSMRPYPHESVEQPATRRAYSHEGRDNPTSGLDHPHEDQEPPAFRGYPHEAKEPAPPESLVREGASQAPAASRPEPEPAPPPPPPPPPSFWDETEAQIGKSVEATAGDDSVRDIWARLQAMGGEAAQAPGAPRQGEAPRGGLAGISADTVVPWEQLELYGAVPAFVNTVKNALVNPGDFFEQLPPSPGKVRPLLFANVVSVLSMIFMLVWFKFGLGPNLSDLGRTDGFQGLGAGTLGSLAWLGLSPILATAFVFLDAGLVHLLLGLLRSATRTFEDTFRAVCYAGSPWLFTLLPVPSSYLIPVIVIWHMTLQAIGLKKLHGAGYPQVLASVLVKWSLYLMASFAVLHVLITRR